MIILPVFLCTGAEDLDLEDPYDHDVSSADTTVPTPDMLFPEGPPTTEKYDPNQPLSKTNLPSFEYLRSAYEIATPDVILDPIVEVLCVIPPAPQYIYVDPDNSEVFSLFFKTETCFKIRRYDTTTLK